MDHWQRWNPAGTLSLIRPNQAIVELASWPGRLFDTETAQRCYYLAYEQAGGILDRWRQRGGTQWEALAHEGLRAH